MESETKPLSPEPDSEKIDAADDEKEASHNDGLPNGDANGVDNSKPWHEPVGNIRTKFEQESTDSPNSHQKHQARLKYAGLQSAKTRFMEEATKSTVAQNGQRKQKEFTPPREGVSVGVLESSPKDRDPNIVRHEEGVDTTREDIVQMAQTKNLLAKFKEMEKGTSLDENREASGNSMSADLSTGATKNMVAKWKDIESSKPEPKPKQKVITREEGGGGVYENEPEVRSDVVRSSEDTVEDKVSVNAKELRETFLRRASESNQKKTNRINPLDEIQELSKRERTTVYENSPQARQDDVFSAAQETESNTPISSNAKEIRERFSNPQINDDQSKAKTPIQLEGSYGGVFENEPVQLDGVVRCGDGYDLETSQLKGKWASEAKQKFIEEASKGSNVKERQKVQLDMGEGGVYENQPVQRLNNVERYEESEPQLPTDAVKSGKLRIEELQEQKSQQRQSSTPVVIDTSTYGGVFENTPQPSQADVASSKTSDEVGCLADETLYKGRYASDAKKKFLQKQIEEEEAKSQKSRPGMINIWEELCEYSGVFENNPAAPKKDIVQHGSSSPTENDMPPPDVMNNTEQH